MSVFVLITTHQFNGRAYMGAAKQLVGAFTSKDEADDWSRKIQERCREIPVRISQLMQQTQWCPTVLSLVSLPVQPETIMATLEWNAESDFLQVSVWQKQGILVLAQVDYWNGRRYSGSRHSLVGPFESKSKADEWGKEFAALYSNGPRHSTTHFSLLDASAIENPTSPEQFVSRLSQKNEQ